MNIELVTPYDELTSVSTPLAIDVMIQWIYDGLEDGGINFQRWFLESEKMDLKLLCVNSVSNCCLTHEYVEK